MIGAVATAATRARKVWTGYRRRADARRVRILDAAPHLDREVLDAALLRTHCTTAEAAGPGTSRDKVLRQLRWLEREGVLRKIRTGRTTVFLNPAALQARRTLNIEPGECPSLPDPEP